MEISKELLDMGLTEELLLFYHMRLSDIAIDKVGGLEHGAIVVCTKDSKNLTKGKHYVLLKGVGAWWYVMNDGGVLCTEMKFFVHLKDWREKQLGDLGI